jgi:hypothetical protein
MVSGMILKVNIRVLTLFFLTKIIFTKTDRGARHCLVLVVGGLPMDPAPRGDM